MSIDKTWQEKAFDRFTICWQQTDTGFRIKYLFDGKDQTTYVLDSNRPRVDISINPPEFDYYTNATVLLSEDPTSQLIITITYGSRSYSMERQECILSPKITCRSMDDLMSLEITDGRYNNMFPFIYIRPWPEISGKDRKNRFVEYDASLAAKGSLYLELLNVSKDRSQIKAKSIAFIEGKSPFEGAYISDMDELNGKIKDFSNLFDTLQSLSLTGLDDLKTAIIKSLAVSKWEDIKDYITGDTYNSEKDRVWQNVFALVIAANYRPNLLDQLIKITIMCRLMERIVKLHEGKELLDTQAEISEAINATLILPEKIFPLPSAAPENDSKDVNEWIEPYAIGDLMMIRERVTGYSPGEIAHIENILKGERKESTQRRLDRINKTQADCTEQTEVMEARDTGLLSEVREDVRETPAFDKQTTTYDNFKTTYGQPVEAVMNGSWNVANSPDPSKPLMRDVDKFAKEITNRNVNSITRRIHRARALGILNEVEETVVHTFDNTQGDRHIQGIYRWVNKHYSARVVRYDNRLMIECLIQDPAASYIASALHREGVVLDEPVSPESLGISSYRDITRETYVKCSETYPIGIIPPPPPQSVHSTESFKSGDALFKKEISIPEHYYAERGTATYIYSGSKDARLYGIIGNHSFVLGNNEKPEDNNSPIQGTEQFDAFNKERLSLPAILTPADERFLTNAPMDPSGAIENTLSYCVNVEITCALSDEAFAEWQIRAYDAVQRAYREMQRSYYDAMKIKVNGAGTENPSRNRYIEKKELKKETMKMLKKINREMTGAGDTTIPSQAIVNEPRYYHFFENAFEWENMYYFFNYDYSKDGMALVTDPERDDLFTDFLQAGSARILLPVSPHHTMAVLYYLMTGIIWNGTNDLTPCMVDKEGRWIPIVNEIKNIKEKKESAEKINDWEFVVPTSMIVLQDCYDLPELK